MKLCKDCRHFRPRIIPTLSMLWGRVKVTHDYARCAAIPSPIDGTPAGFCENQRGVIGKCGEDAKLFEPINTQEAA